MTAPAIWPVARLRQIGGGIWILTAGLAVLGSFLPLIEQSIGVRNSTKIAMNAWGVVGDVGFEFLPATGVPIAVSAVLLLAAGLLGLASTRSHPASAVVLAARLLGTGAAGLLAGSTTVIMLYFRVFDLPESDPTGNGYQVNIGLGAWVLLGTGAIAVGAIVLMLVPKIARRGEEPETPPMGIPVVRVLEPEYEETDPKG